MKLTGSEAFVKTLESLGVDTMFGIPGDHTHFYDALLRTTSIRHVLVRHEQCAAHMADGYARESGKVGVCDAANGPGATNLVTAIAEACTDGTPVIAIASNIPKGQRGRGCFQEVDQLSIFKPITKIAIDVQVASRIPEYVRRAFQIAVTGKPGPAFLNVPLDVLRETFDYDESDFQNNARWGIWPAMRVRAEMHLLEAAIDLLGKAERPLIWCGGGVTTAGAWEGLAQLCDMTGIPVVTTFMGKGSIAENHPLSLGPVGMLGRTASNEYVKKADVVLALGTRFSNLDTAAGLLPVKGTKVIHVDVDPTELDRNVRTEICIWSDVRLFLEDFLVLCQKRKVGHLGIQTKEEISNISDQWRHERGALDPRSEIVPSETVHPLQVIRAMRETMRSNDTIICDSGFNQIWGGQYFELDRPGRSYIAPRGFGTMGFALPAAIGAKLASPEKCFVALQGDGGFAMVMQELETSVRINAPIVVVIMNNRNLEYIKQVQRANFEGRFISVDFTDIDHAAIARGMGCRGIRITDATLLKAALLEALGSKVTTVLDVVTPESVLPDRIAISR